MRPARPTLLLAAVAATVAAAIAVRPSESTAQPVAALREHRWARRVLVVLAPASGGAEAATYDAQRREFARAAELLAERDVLVLDVAAATSAARDRTLRRQLGVPASGFAVVLVGKDGGVKLRRRTVLSAETVLGTIDRMPMGAAEARRRGRG